MLTKLPPEILMLIISKADLIDQLALRATSQKFSSLIFRSEEFWSNLMAHKKKKTKEIDQIKILIKENPDEIIQNSIPVERRLQKFKEQYGQYPKEKSFTHYLSWKGFAGAASLGLLSGTIFSLGIFFEDLNSTAFLMCLVTSWFLGIIPFIAAYMAYSSLYSSARCVNYRFDKFEEQRDGEYKDLKLIVDRTIFKL